ncbi:hypothetical protein EZV62_026582 [Acer yangbiense]|uniref:Rx N-terminal domain-containing protein n=1 Tax=Acer yangbiense TaxID=1000413 RepID=A0A5C7GRG1_9ROSI|nr:hypothetical protein EZV62_026582 [Acer yangbiense]
MSIPLLDCMIPDPEDGFPTNLTSLSVGGVNISKAFLEWGLHRLTSLKRPDMISFPMLPTSLTTLHIFDFRNLERLSPDFQDLSSLEELELRSCPNLKFFPEKGLPSSLKLLHINKCPLLKQSCEKDKGLYWPMIALVPTVYIDRIPKAITDDLFDLLSKFKLASSLICSRWISDGYSSLTRTNLQESFQQKSSDRSTDKVREVLKLDQEMRDLSVQSYWFEGVLEVKEVRVGVPQVQAM